MKHNKITDSMHKPNLEMTQSAGRNRRIPSAHTWVGLKFHYCLKSLAITNDLKVTSA
jgi:hypothetical protein